MSPFLHNSAHHFSQDSLKLSPFLVMKSKDFEKEEMKELINIFIQSDFKPKAPSVFANKYKKPQFDNKRKVYHKSQKHVSSKKSAWMSQDITTYRPVPVVPKIPHNLPLNDDDKLADILAKLIVDQIVDEESDDLQNKKLLRLLKILVALDENNKINEKRDKIKPGSQAALFQQNNAIANIPDLPGPPYLPPNYFSSNDAVTPTSRPNSQTPKNLFQTDFNKQHSSSQPYDPFETSIKSPTPRPFNVQADKYKNNNLNAMIKQLMSDVDSNHERKNLKKKLKRKPYFPKPEKQDINVVVSDEKKTDEYSPFSRYPVKVPKTKKNKYFSLPIDAFASNNNADPVKVSSRNSDENFVSFDEQLLEMLQNLGKTYCPTCL